VSFDEDAFADQLYLKSNIMFVIFTDTAGSDYLNWFMKTRFVLFTCSIAQKAAKC